MVRMFLFIDNEDDDDVEGYFCTVCDTKIPNLEQHIQQFHTGQEIILQVTKLKFYESVTVYRIRL